MDRPPSDTTRRSYMRGARRVTTRGPCPIRIEATVNRAPDQVETARMDRRREERARGEHRQWCQEASSLPSPRALHTECSAEPCASGVVQHPLRRTRLWRGRSPRIHAATHGAVRPVGGGERLAPCRRGPASAAPGPQACALRLWTRPRAQQRGAVHDRRGQLGDTTPLKRGETRGRNDAPPRRKSGLFAGIKRL
jgi:hypothetical protein